jgi:ADP-ribosylglycohydrolase
MMKGKEEAMVMASFVGDSLALAAHWIYDSNRIVREFGRVDRYLQPPPDSYHPTKESGEFTHYGDQTYVLLESIATKKGFDLNDFAARWQALFDEYDGYYDQATKATLRNFALGSTPEAAGSSSNDLAGAARIAPLVCCYRDQLELLVSAARAQTGMTHQDASVIASAEFFARVSWEVLHGTSPVSAMETVAEQDFTESPLFAWVRQGIKTANDESVATIVRLGQSCHVHEAFPGVVHLVAKYESNLKEAMIQAVMAGGDSAARAMIVGMVLAAQLGEEGLPLEWVEGLRRSREILDLLTRIRVNGPEPSSSPA